jgi:hypothetical protein
LIGPVGLGEQRFDDALDHGFLRGHVIVERGHVNGEARRDAAQRHGRQSLLVRHLDGDRHDVFPGQARVDHRRLLDDRLPTL